MSFEKEFKKQFPSLKRFLTLWNSGDFTSEDAPSRRDDSAIPILDVELYCLDKQRVLKAIEKIENEWDGLLSGMEALKKELGLQK